MQNFFMKRYYVVIQLPTCLLCERAVETSNGYLLYEYVPEGNMFIDSGYVKDLEDLKFIIRARYGFHKSVHLLESFEEVVKMFDTPLPRIISLSRAQEFCTQRGDVLFVVKWDYDAEGHLFYKRFEWLLDGEPPANIAEAMKRLNEYAEKYDRWIVFKQLIKDATAYEVYP
jgi:hypothetical protein